MRAHLTHLDRAIARMLDERARLAAEMAEAGATESVTAPLVDDVLRRAGGDFPADALRDVFEAVARGCRRAAEEATR